LKQAESDRMGCGHPANDVPLTCVRFPVAACLVHPPHWTASSLK